MTSTTARPELTTVTITTDCLGIDSPIMALRSLGIPHRQLWYSDLLPAALAVTLNNCGAPEMVFGDMMQRDDHKLPRGFILYVVGCPCQPFSTAGQEAAVQR